MREVIAHYGSAILSFMVVIFVLGAVIALTMTSSNGTVKTGLIGVTEVAEEDNLADNEDVDIASVSIAQDYANRTASEVETVTALKNHAYNVNDIISPQTGGAEVSVVSVSMDKYTANDRDNISAGRKKTHVDYTDSVLSVNALGQQVLTFDTRGRYYVRYRIIQNGGTNDGGVRTGNIWIFVREK